MISRTIELDDYDDLVEEAAVVQAARQWCSQRQVAVNVSHLHRCWEYASALRALRGLPAATTPVIDVGCGRGLFGACVGLGGYLTIEIDPEVKAAHERFPGLPVSTYPGSIQDLPQLGTFGAVFCLSVMEHVPPAEQEESWRLLARAVRPGGVFFATVDYGPVGRIWGDANDREVTYDATTMPGIVDILRTEGLVFGPVEYDFRGPRVRDYTFFRLLGHRP